MLEFSGSIPATAAIDSVPGPNSIGWTGPEG